MNHGENADAVNAMPPSWPKPSFNTQFSAAAMGMAPAPIPTAKLSSKTHSLSYSIDWVLSTPPAALNPMPNDAQEQYLM